MKLFVFFILVVGAIAHANSKTLVGRNLENALKKEDLSFMVLITREQISLFATILSKYWLLSPFPYIMFTSPIISVQTDVTNPNGQKYEIDFVIGLEDEEITEPAFISFSLIKLKNPIEFGDNVKPISLSKPGDELKEGELVKTFYMNRYVNIPKNNAKSLETFDVSSLKITDQDSCNSWLGNNKSFCSKFINTNCKVHAGSPTILNGKLVGFSLSYFDTCSDSLVAFLKTSLIYHWIEKHVSELN